MTVHRYEIVATHKNARKIMHTVFDHQPTLPRATARLTDLTSSWPQYRFKVIALTTSNERVPV